MMINVLCSEDKVVGGSPVTGEATVEDKVEVVGGHHLEVSVEGLEDFGVVLLHGGDASRGNLVRPEDL